MSTRAGPCFEDFVVGQDIVHATPRTVGDGEISQYIALTGSRCAISSATSTAALAGLPTRPLDGWLVFNLAFGQTVREISTSAIANLGYAELRFLRPVFAGDTLRSTSRVIGCRTTSKGDSGIVYVQSTCFNQHDEPAMRWVRWVLLPRGGEARGASIASVPDLSPCVPVEELCTACRFDGEETLQRWCAATGSGRLWDDYRDGEAIPHPLSLTVEESDHMSATRLYQNLAQVHFSAMPANGGRRLVYGGHVISLCQSISHHGLENLVHPVAVNGGSHLKPVYAGDELRAVTHVLERWPLSGRKDIAAIRLRLLGVKNSRNATLQIKDDDTTDIVLDLDYTAVIPRSSS